MADRLLRVVIAGDVKGLEGAVSKALGETKKAEGGFGKLAQVGKAAFIGIAAGAATVGVVSLKMGAEFQTSMTQLVTGAHESEKTIGLVSKGILDMAGKVGQTPQKLAAGMYMIASAGYHGAAGLKVLQAAAEGAKVGNAEMATVADALTSALNAYHLPASKAVSVTNMLVATVGQGKMHMQDLAGAIGSVLAPAALAHIKLSEVGGAIATMTAQGTDAHKATMYLRQTILMLENPTKAAATEMEALGLSAIDVSSHLGQRGLAGTFKLLTDAIKSHMGPGGTVFIEKLQSMAKHTSTFQKVLANLPPVQQTYVAALAKMVGGTKSMMAALELTGVNAKTFADNTGIVALRMNSGSTAVDGWAKVQKDLAFQTDQLKATMAALGTKIGLWLIPKVQQLAAVTMKVIDWLGKHKTIATALAVVIGGVLLAATVAWTVSLFTAGGALAFLMSPITLVVAGVAALAYGIYVAYEKFGWFHTAVDAAWTILQSVFGWIKDHWQLTLALLTGPIGLAAKFIKDHWDGIWGGIEAATSTAVGIVMAIIQPLIDAFKWALNVGGAVAGFFTGGGHNGNAARPSWAPPVFPGQGPPQYKGPAKAVGGPVSAMSTYRVNELGEEFFTPTSNGTIIPAGKWGGTGTVHFHLAVGYGVDGNRLMTEMANALERDRRSGGAFTNALKAAVA